MNITTKQTKRDCLSLIALKSLPYQIVRIGQTDRLVSTETGIEQFRSSIPVISWTRLYEKLEAMKSLTPTPDPEPVAVLPEETPAQTVELV